MNRLRKVVNFLISDTQSAFIRGRQILDGVLIANEMIDEVQKCSKEAILFKVDFEKAYDSMDWKYLDWIMEQMGFECKWREWILECLSSKTVSLLVNGSPTKEFKVGRGLRQGDPLSSFFFIGG